MKNYYLPILLIFSACHLQIKDVGEHLLLQSPNQQFSCYTNANNNGGSNCCYPYKEKLMICGYTAVNDIADESGSIVIRLVPDNKGK